MKNVYDKINDLDFETDEFELNDIEREKLYMTAKNYKKKSNKKYMAVAAALLLALGLTVPPVRAEVSKFTTDVKVSFMETFGASPESYKYVTELHKPITIGNDSFVLENLAIEDNKMYVNILRESERFEDALDFKNESMIYKVVINGETYKSDGSSGSAGINPEGTTYTNSSMIVFDKEFPEIENANIDIYMINGNKTEIVSITAPSNVANKENKILAENYELENGAVVKLMKVNPITMTAVIDNLDKDYDYKIDGFDKDGNEISLDIRTGVAGEMTFLYNKDFSDLSLDEIKDGRDIIFTLSRAKISEISGRITNDNYEKIAEFTLSAK